MIPQPRTAFARDNFSIQAILLSHLTLTPHFISLPLTYDIEVQIVIDYGRLNRFIRYSFSNIHHFSRNPALAVACLDDLVWSEENSRQGTPIATLRSVGAIQAPTHPAQNRETP